MAPSSKDSGPHSRTTRDSRVGIVRFVAAVIALTLIGIAAWGLWATADVARLVANASTPSAKHNLSVATFLLVWLVFFGPFLYFGVAILWSTFAPEKRGWLVPLRLFTFVVSLRAAAEGRRRLSRNKSGEKVLPAPRLPEQVAQPPDSTHGAGDH